MNVGYNMIDGKTADEQIKASLEEKKILLREIHHQVKNNLAVISSLLWLQSRYAKDEYHRRMFIESGDRIRSVAMAHEKLYQAENVSAINSESYLTDLVNELMSSLGHVGSQIELQIESAEVELDLEIGTALGLIVTELVSNCLKHAFPGHRAGKISLALKEIDESTLELSVADDGVGLPQNIQLDKPNTLGLDLVRILSNQLRGHFEIRRDRGTEIVLRFRSRRMR